MCYRVFCMVQTRRLEVLHSYVNEVTGLTMHEAQCESAPLPMHVRHTFDLVCVRMGATDCVLAMAKQESHVTPAAAEKLVPIIGRAYQRLVVLILPDLPAWARRGFIERKLPFITPNRQMFLPHLGFDYRDRIVFQKTDGPGLDRRQATLTPSEQLVLLFMLLSKGNEFYADDVLKRLEVSRMTVSRAFRGLEDRGLIERPKRGRKRPALLRQVKRAIWNAAQPFMQNPIKEMVVSDQREFPFPKAGLTALSEITDIAAPPYRTVAASADSLRNWESISESWKLDRKTIPEPGDVVIQVWTYDPVPLASEGQVDPLSLYLTLTDTTDDRVDIARDRLLEVVKWQP